MATYQYFPNVPNGPDDPADDQPQMQVNTASLASLIGEDHIAFNTPNGGFHKWWRMPVQLVIPPGLIANSITGYSKTVSGTSQLFITPGTSGNEFQLTSMNNANFATFGTNTAYSGTFEGGWTFLPGGLLLQYGRGTVGTSSSGTVFPFPRTFAAATIPFSIVLQMERDASNVDVVYLVPGSADNAQFTARQTSSASRDINWFAIGRA